MLFLLPRITQSFVVFQVTCLASSHILLHMMLISLDSSPLKCLSLQDPTLKHLTYEPFSLCYPDPEITSPPLISQFSACMSLLQLSTQHQHLYSSLWLCCVPEYAENPRGRAKQWKTSLSSKIYLTQCLILRRVSINICRIYDSKDYYLILYSMAHLPRAEAHRCATRVC